jgi:LruC domain-containing protein
MKKIFFITALISLGLTSGINAQVTLNFESGNRAIEQGNCWAFGAATYSNLEFRIAGFWSGRSNQLTSDAISSCWIKTPWMLPESGNITMKARLDNDSGTMRGIVFSYISYNPAAPTTSKEGTTTSFYTYTFPTPHSITIRDLTIPMPAAIANSNTPYKILISFIGTGGSSRAFADDINIPGTYSSDPANGCLPLTQTADADKDGVEDKNDAYPNDIHRAYNSYFPSLSQAGSLAFEDLWPAKGDFDFNDMVVDYRLQTVTNAENNVVEVFADFTLKASGASFRNGFGFQLDGISPDKIIRVNGNSIASSSIYSFMENGLESNQTYATCIVFSDFYKVMPWPGSGKGINTDKLSPFTPHKTLNVHLVFIDNGVVAPGGALKNTELMAGVFNFFIVTETWTGETVETENGTVRITKPDRGKEIHLADRIPTSLVNQSLFGTVDDDSNPASGKYYKTANNLPWAISILQGFDYPTEKTPVNEAYVHFLEWAASAGNSFTDWYSNTSGYRNSEKIY